jgi:hypothetical protein
MGEKKAFVQVAVKLKMNKRRLLSRIRENGRQRIQSSNYPRSRAIGPFIYNLSIGPWAVTG